MKIVSYIVLAVAAIALPLAVSAQGIADLANPDDIMLRKPTKPVQPAVQPKAQPVAQPVVAPVVPAEDPAAKARAEAERKEKENAAELAKLREQVAAAEQARQQALKAQQQAEKKVKAEQVAREQAEAQAKTEREAAEAAKARAQEAEKAALAAKKKKLEAQVRAGDVVAAAPNADKKGSGSTIKVKKTLTGRPAVITADRTDYDRKEGVILFDRNVYVDDEQYQMHADRLFVFLDGTNDLKRIVALGNVSITNEAKTAACAKAVYSRADQRIIMFGQDEQHLAWLRDAGSKKGDSSEISGMRITYWFDSEIATVEGVKVKVPGIKGGGNPKDLFGPNLGGKGEKKKDK